MADGIVGVALTALGAVLGVGGTYIFDLRKAQRERAERNADSARERARLRSTVATALLQDMRVLECQLSEIFYFDEPTRYVPTRQRLFFDSHAGDIRLFAAQTIQALTEFYRRYNQLLSAYDMLPQLEHARTRTAEEIDHELQSEAGYTLQSLQVAVETLRHEGGLIDQYDDWSPVEFPTLPAVPRPVFEATAKVIAQSPRKKPSRGA